MDRNQAIKFADNLKKLMDSRHLTVTSAAKQIGMNKSTLHNYCNGVMPRNLLKIKELADLLGVSLNELIFGESSEPTGIGPQDGIEGRYEVTIKRVDAQGKKNKSTQMDF